MESLQKDNAAPGSLIQEGAMASRFANRKSRTLCRPCQAEVILVHGICDPGVTQFLACQNGHP